MEDDLKQFSASSPIEGSEPAVASEPARAEVPETPDAPETLSADEGGSGAPEKPKKRGLRAWWSAHKPTKRRLIQLYAALLTNANIKGFATGRIYNGATKNMCVPGLNCYSCPGAVGACPLGALQNALAQSGTRAPFFVIGIILLYGLIFARTICGFLCPFGLIQDLLYKIKTPKLKKSRVTRALSYLKYVILAVFVVALPVIFGVLGGTAVPAFCKYICPAGTSLGAVSLLSNKSNADMFGMLGGLFTWKFCVMVAIIVACIFIYRAFCRFFCPLGALYGLFNRIALLGVKLDKNECTDCGLCVAHCKMDIHHVGDHECINCGECIPVCPAKAISWKGSKLFVHANAVEAPAAEENALSMLSRGPLEAAAPASQAPVMLSAMAAPAALSQEEMTAPERNEKSEKPARPKKSKAFWLELTAWIAALALLVGALVYYNFIAQDRRTEPYKMGETVSDFTLSCYNGREDFALSDAKGKIVFINFWATWCGPCVNELPHFEQLKETYGDDIEVIAVHSTNITEDVQSYISGADRRWDEWNITFAQDEDDEYYYTLLGGKDSYPVTAILDREGKLQVVQQGSVTYDMLEAYYMLLSLS